MTQATETTNLVSVSSESIEALPLLVIEDERSVMDLRPGETFGKAGRVYLVVDEGVGRGIGLLAGSLL